MSKATTTKAKRNLSTEWDALWSEFIAAKKAHTDTTEITARIVQWHEALRWEIPSWAA